MKRRPGAPLLGLGETGGVAQPVAKRAHVGFAGRGAALHVLAEQAVGPPDRRVGVIVGTHRANAGIHPQLFADRSVDHRDRRERGGAAGPGGDAAGGHSQDNGQVVGTGAGHDRVDRDLLDVELPEFAEGGRPHPADDLLGGVAGAFQHAFHPLFGGQDDRQVVGPAVLDEQLAQVVLGVGLQEARRRALEGRALEVLLGERLGQAIDDALHEGALQDRIRSLDVAAQLRDGGANDRLWNVAVADRGPAAGEGCRLGQPREHVGVDRDGRNTLFLERQ